VINAGNRSANRKRIPFVWLEAFGKGAGVSGDVPAICEDGKLRDSHAACGKFQILSKMTVRA
jgi:hypothetical protein